MQLGFEITLGLEAYVGRDFLSPCYFGHLQFGWIRLVGSPLETCGIFFLFGDVLGLFLVCQYRF